MARGSGLNLLGAVFSQLALFLIMAVLALRLGKADVGRYAECYALLSLLGLLSLAGFRAGLTRFVAIHLADGDPGRLRGTVRLGLGLTIAGSLILGVALASAAPYIAGLFHDPSMTKPVYLVALTLPASTFEDAALSATQGWRSQKSYALIGLIYDPGCRLLLSAAAILAGLGLVGVLWALVVSAWTGALLSGWALHRRLHGVPRAARIYGAREILAFSTISWLSSLASTGLIWADTLLLGRLATQSDVGTYTVATRLVTLAVFVMAPINAAFLPHMAHLWHVGDRVGVARAYGTANRWMVRLSLPAFIVLLVFPGDLLRFFGHGFATAAAVTSILAVGQLMNALAGPCGVLLNMSGRVVLTMADNVIILILNIVLNIILIPRFTLIGAAIAWTVSLSLVNAAKLLQVRWIVGVRGIDVHWGKTILAAIPASLIGLIIGSVSDDWLLTASVGSCAVAVAFFAALFLLKIGDDDQRLVRSILGHRTLRAS